MQWFVATYVISGSSSIFSASWVCETSDGVSSGSMNSAFSRLAFFCWPPFTFRSHATSCPVPDALCSLIRVAFLILGNWFRTPRCTPFLQQLRVDYSGRTGAALAQNVQSLTHLRNLCFGLVPVATRRSRQRIPVIRRVTAAQHRFEYGVGIGFAACGP